MQTTEKHFYRATYRIHFSMWKWILLLYILICIHHAYAVSNITFNPGLITIEASPAPGIFDGIPVQVAVSSEHPNWSLSCLIERLLHESGQHSIEADRFSIQHAYSGEEFIPFDTSIYLANGGATDGYVIVNTLILKVRVRAGDVAGTYHGLLRAHSDELGEAVLPICLNMHEHFKFHASEETVHFDICGPPDIYPCREKVFLNVHGNTPRWHINARIDPIKPGGNHIQPASFYINIGTDHSSQNRGRVRNILKGKIFSEETQLPLYMGLKTNWKIPPGTYTTTIRLFNTHEYGSHHQRNIKAIIKVCPYMVMHSCENCNVEVSVTGAPGDYVGTPDMPLMIESNTSNWAVSAEIFEDLSSSLDMIPRDRIYLYSSAMPSEGYRPLSNKLLVAMGEQAGDINDLYCRVKIKTTYEDVAGEYNGKIRYTVFNLPD